MPGPVVRVENVVKTFGDIHALDGVSLEFEPGIIYGLLGPNGAGKTTLIRVLTTLLKPDSGRAWVAGIDVVGNANEARHHIGLAGQFAAVDDYLTGRENVEMVGLLYNLGAAEARRRADEVLERIHLTDAADRPVKTYSGGMRRRLDLAASMVGRPQVLFLDEPTTGIDPRSRIDLWDLIRDLVDGGTTILLTTQYLEEADNLAARIAVIDQGRVITEGTGDELKDRLGGAVVELSVPAAERQAAITAIGEISGDHASFEPSRQKISIAATGPATLTEVVRRLDGASITPDDIALRKPTLDDVFLSLTGHIADGHIEKDETKNDQANGSRRRRRSR